LNGIHQADNRRCVRPDHILGGELRQLEEPLRRPVWNFREETLDSFQDFLLDPGVSGRPFEKVRPRLRGQVLLEIAKRAAPLVELLERIVRPQLVVDRLPCTVDLDSRVGIAVVGLLILPPEGEGRAVGDFERRAPNHPWLEIRRRKPVLLFLGLHQDQQGEERVSHFPSLIQVSLNATQPILDPNAWITPLGACAADM
jgi:hypothetical protein